MSASYSATVLEHFRRPRNQRRLDQPATSHEAHNPLCGDRVRIEIAVAGGVVSDAAFTASACAICTAAASLLTLRLPGLTVRAALAIGDAELLAALDAALPDARHACAALPLVAAREALRQLPAPE
jgi:nitrogen fixation protein NifU and related proteins